MSWPGQGLGQTWAMPGQGLGQAWAMPGPGLAAMRAMPGPGLGAMPGQGLGQAWMTPGRGQAWGMPGQGVGQPFAMPGQGLAMNGNSSWQKGGTSNSSWQMGGNGTQSSKDESSWQDNQTGTKRNFSNASWNDTSSWKDTSSSWKDSSSWKKDTSSWKSKSGSNWKSSGDSRNPRDRKAEEEEEVVVDAVSNPSWAFLKSSSPEDSESLSAEASSKRESMEIIVMGETKRSCTPPISSFEELAGVLPQYVMTALSEAGMLSPMTIQAQTLPFVLRGFDLIGIAKTGSGKTLSFLLPAIAHVEAGEKIAWGSEGPATPIALVLAPVRELAIQIAEEANKLLTQSKSDKHDYGIGAVALYGGGARHRNMQVKDLQRGWCHILAATPGRVCDLTTSNDLSLSGVTYFVLDEADRMLDSGFEEQLDTIGGALRPDRQTLFFSATWPAVVRNCARRMCHTPPIKISVGQQEESSGPTTRGDIVQEIVVFDGDLKDNEAQKKELLNAHLRTLLANEEYKILVFVNMKNMAWELAGQLNEEGFKADFMYGGRSQDARKEVVDKFKVGEIKLLVTTDVMARGLDIPGISHAVIFDCYGDIDEYVHRIGRTARGPYGCGHALTFFEYDPKFADMAGQLVDLLTTSGQVVPEKLQQIADEVANGQRERKYKKQKW